ncbi:hypothetical protein [Thauera humireducens]|uniref:hypothetical protein n=1 Tax=Thauera humireducens TaxID=1134435 RepID=UPI00311E4547
MLDFPDVGLGIAGYHRLRQLELIAAHERERLFSSLDVVLQALPNLADEPELRRVGRVVQLLGDALRNLGVP